MLVSFISAQQGIHQATLTGLVGPPHGFFKASKGKKKKVGFCVLPFSFKGSFLSCAQDKNQPLVSLPLQKKRERKGNQELVFVCTASLTGLLYLLLCIESAMRVYFEGVLSASNMRKGPFSFEGIFSNILGTFKRYDPQKKRGSFAC